MPDEVLGMSESDGDEMNEPWIWRGSMKHAEAAHSDQEVLNSCEHIEWGLHLIAGAIEAGAANMNADALISNELGSVACFTRAFRAIRAAALLALSGLVHEARVYVRDIYESASMGRFLASLRSSPKRRMFG